jgi:alginate O-acetyltransferase complex protein AlgJ
MTWSFVAILFSVPISQAALELVRKQAPQALSIFQPLQVGVSQALRARWQQAGEAFATAVSRPHLRSFESELERSSWAKNFFQPRLQVVLTGKLGFGNDKVTLGLDGWLYFQPGVDYLTGRDFVDQGVLATAAKKMVDKKGEADPQPDPRPAIIELHRALASAGIHFVVMPTPDKAMLQPRELARRMQTAKAERVPGNPGYTRFIRELRSQGIDLMDCIPDVVRPGEVRYLVQDTHWTPEFMQQTARELARHVERSVALPPRPFDARLVPVQVSRVGDLVDMLKLPAGQALYTKQTVTIQQVVDNTTGRPWEPDQNADVLLLGDSFANIFSQPGMGWGQAAGLAEHLSYELKRPLDTILFNGGGVLATRAELARRENLARLAGKRVVIYQFALRDLLGQNWKPVSLPAAAEIVAARRPAPAAPLAALEKPAAKIPERAVAAARPAVPSFELVVVGRIVKTSEVPLPETAPYKDCLTFVKLQVEKVESGAYEKDEIIAVFVAMKDAVWMPPARYAVGERFRLKLIPMRKADKAIRSMQRADNLDDIDLQPYLSIWEDRL